MSCDWQEIVSSVPNKSKCPRCGTANKCAIEEGKSYSACWCMSLPKIESEANHMNSCLCKSCLSKVISPCIKQCRLDRKTERCSSCKRSLYEIKHWQNFTIEQKLDIINRNKRNSNEPC